MQRSKKTSPVESDLPLVAKRVRSDILAMSYRANSAHTGGALSCVELLVSLYFRVLRIDPNKPLAAERDRFIFSKAHDAKALYSVLAQRGFFPASVLLGYEKDNGALPGHTIRHCVPGVEVSAGSLGHGLSMAAGMAWSLKHNPIIQYSNKQIKKPRVFVMISDGECDEGSTWEAALFAGHHKLGNLTVIVDYNKLQGYGTTTNVLDLEPFDRKWRAFGFETLCIDGHAFPQILKALKVKHEKPLVIIARTIKGLGGPKQYVNEVSSQYKPPTEEEYRSLI